MMRELSGRPDLCSINTATLGFQAPLPEVIDAVARAGFGGISPWRREVEGQDMAGLARQIRDAGLKVPGYCRSTYIPSTDHSGFLKNVEANRRAITDAGRLGAETFVMVVGGLPLGSRDLAAARGQVADACGTLSEHARICGVRLALEPLHPVYAAERSCLTLLSEAIDMAEAIGRDIGICLDVYHIWWDPNLARDIARAAGRISNFHICDWLVPTADVLNDRGMMGDGVIDIPAIRQQVETAGFQGLVEVEIFSAANWWQRPMAETLGVIRDRLAKC
jgi:sugar phosphate isomerase/epimerase